MRTPIASTLAVAALALPAQSALAASPAIDPARPDLDPSGISEATEAPTGTDSTDPAPEEALPEPDATQPAPEGAPPAVELTSPAGTTAATAAAGEAVQPNQAEPSDDEEGDGVDPEECADLADGIDQAWALARTAFNVAPAVGGAQGSYLVDLGTFLVDAAIDLENQADEAGCYGGEKAE